MRFDNRQFESGVKQSLSTLDKLKQSLSFKGVSDSLKHVSSSGAAAAVSGLGSAVDAVGVRFRALDVIGMTALSNITNSAMRAGEQLLKSFTITPIKTGFQEYELKMGSIQTIMAGTGESLQTVNKYLNELNTYSDKTIYSFQDMTTNIAKFTNAGVKLDSAVKAIQGISNEAAISGANANEAARAMYNFAQAMSSGVVRLIDWKSIENANMATVEFKNELIKTAEAMGNLVKQGDTYISTTTDMKGHVSDAFNASRAFNDSLSAQWLTGEVLVATLEKYSDTTTELGRRAFAAAQDVKTFSMMMDTLREAAQSGWAQTWEIIVGNFEEAKVLWTEFANRFGDAIGAAAEARNNFVNAVLESNVSVFEETVKRAGVDVEDLYSKILEIHYHYSGALEDLIGEGKTASDILRDLNVPANDIISAIRAMADEAQPLKTEVVDITDQIAELMKIFQGIMDGDYGYAYDDIVKNLSKLGEGAEYVADSLDFYLSYDNYDWADFILSYEGKLLNLSEKVTGYTEEEIAAMRALADEAEKTGTPLNDLINALYKESGRELIIDTMRNGLTAIETTVKEFKGAWKDIFNVDPAQVFNAIDAIHEFSLKLKDTDSYASKLRDTFRGVFAGLDIFRIVIRDIGRFGLDIFNKVLDETGFNLLDITANAGNAVTAFRDWVKENDYIYEGLVKISEKVYSAYEAVRDWVIEVSKLPKVSDAINVVSETFSDLAEESQNYFSKSREELDKFIDRIKSGETLTPDDFKKAMSNIEGSLSSFFDKMGDSTSAAKDRIRNDLDNIKAELGVVGEWFKYGKSLVQRGFDGIKSIVSDNILAIIAILTGGGILHVVHKIFDVIEALTAPLSVFSSKSFDKVLKATAKLVKSHANKNNADALFVFAESVAVLTASLLGLAMFPDTDKLIRVSGVLLGLSVGLTAFATANALITKHIGSTSAFAGAGSLMALAFGLKILVKAINDIDVSDPGVIKKRLEVMSVLMGELSVFATLAGSSIKIGNKFDFKSGGSSFGSYIGMAIAIKILASTLNDIGDIPVDGLGRSIGVMTVLMTALTVMQHFTKGSDWKSGVGMLAMVGSIKLFVLALDDIAELDLKKISRAIPRLIGIVLSFKILMSATSDAGSNAGKSGLAMVAVATSLLILVPALQMIGSLPVSRILKGTAAISAVMLMFSVLIKASEHAGPNAIKAGAMLVGVSASLLMLSGSIALLGKIPLSNLAAATVAVDSIMAMFAGLMVASKLSSINSKDIIVLTVSVAGLALAVGMLSKNPPENILAAAGALSALSVAMGILGVIGKHVDSGITTVASLTIIVIAIAAVLNELSKIDPERSIGSAIALSTVLLSMSAAMGIMALIGKAGPAATEGLFWFSAVVGALGAVLTAVGALFTQFDELDDFLDKGIDILVKIGEGIGEFIGVLIGAVGGGVIEGFNSTGGAALEELGSHLSVFGDNVGGFIDTVNDVDEGTLTGAGCLAGAILKFKSVSKFDISDDFADSGLKLTEFAENCAGFFDITNDLNTESINGVSTLIDILDQLRGNVFVDLFKTDVDFEQLKTDLSSFGQAIKGYSDVISDGDGLNESAITASKTATEIMIALASELPSTGGLLGWIIGTNKETLATFGEQLTEFGSALSGYSATVSEEGAVNSMAIEASKTAALVMVELAKELPEQSHSLLGWVLGEDKTSLSEFGGQLSAFGSSLVVYSAVVSKEGAIDKTAIEASKTAADIMVELAKELPENGNSLLGLIMGTNKENLASFGEQLAAFGESLVSFSESMSGTDFDMDLVSNIALIAKSFADTATIVKTAGESSTGVSVANMASFGEQLASFSVNFAVFTTNLAGVNTDDIREAQAAIESLGDFEAVDLTGLNESLSASAREGMDGFISVFVDGKSRAESTIKSIISGLGGAIRLSADLIMDPVDRLIAQILDHIVDKGDDINEAGKSLVAKLSEGIDDNSNTVIASVDTLALNCISTVDEVQEAFYQVGMYCAQGFANGIADSAYAAEINARAMANAAADAAASALDEHSPSKVLTRVGKFFSEGFAIGILKSAGMSEENATKLAERAKKAVMEALQNIQDLIDGDLDMSPVIHPIIDLDDIYNGFNEIATLYKYSQPGAITGIRNNIDAISTDVRPSLCPELVELINRFKADMQQVIDNIGNLQVIMDTGTLVGAISRPMDNALGNRAIRERRGV